MHNQQKTKKTLLICLATLVLFGIVSLYLANAVPDGATIVGSPSIDTGPNRTAQSRQDPGGRIISLTLNLEQQDNAWKAYVGNITGTYVLKNSNNFSIYEWPLGTTINGEVYISRNSSANFSTGAITCANNSEMVTEQTFLGMSNSASDNINNTFNSTSHALFSVGYNNIPQNNCSAIALWVNDTSQSAGPSAVFQEVALHDGNTLIYAALINNDQTGFDNSTRFDFQAIVAENRSSSTGTPYYFYIELGGS